MVEDNPADLYLIRDAIRQAAVDVDVHTAGDGEKAIRFFSETEPQPCPTLVLLDINLPKRHGAEVLEFIRQSRCARCMVLVVTSSNSERDRNRMAALGIDGYFQKPSDYDQFLKLGEVVRQLLERLASERG